MMISWPKVFTDPDFEYDLADDATPALALADGLCGWACCVMAKPPEQFGHGMVKVGDIVGTATPDGLHTAFGVWKAKQEIQT